MEKLFYCQLCSYTSNRNYNLIRHLNTCHKEEKPTKNDVIVVKEEEQKQDLCCYKCDKKYKTKKSLINHQQKCNGLNILACPKCLFIFSSRISKSAHIKRDNCKPAEPILNSNYASVVITFNYIYLIKEREFIDKNINVFKLGKTTQQSNKRLHSYPKGCSLVFHMICIDCDKIETILLKLFNHIFIKRCEYGNEYFQGNHIEMIKTIYNTILTN